jgi:hypothetical protein
MFRKIGGMKELAMGKPFAASPSCIHHPADSAILVSFPVSTTDNPAPGADESITHAGHLASLIFPAAGLERGLRDSALNMFDTGAFLEGPHLSLGSGQSFTVERAERRANTAAESQRGGEFKPGNFVALKYVRRPEGTITNWSAVLLEIRTLRADQALGTTQTSFANVLVC